MRGLRGLLAFDPFLPPETRTAIAAADPKVREQLVALGLTECEAAILLGETWAPAEADHD